MMSDSETLFNNEKDVGEEFWRTSPSFIVLIRSMYKQKIATDTILKVELGDESKSIECHSLILSAHSPVFRTMLSTRWDTDISPNQGKERQRIVTLKDDDPDHVLQFVNRMYYDWDEKDKKNDIPANLAPQTVVGIFALAHKYLASHIIVQSENWIRCFLSKRSAIADICILYSRLRSLPICNLEQIARKIYRTVKNCILTEGEVIFSSDAILNLTSFDLVEILKDNLLQCPEKIVFDGCYKWAKEKCKLNELDVLGENIKFVLGDVLKYIRFPLLDMTTIIETILPAKILAQDEAMELMASKMIKGFYRKGIANYPPRFPYKNRVCESKAFQIRRLDVNIKDISKNLIDFSVPHGFIMTTSMNMLLRGMLFYGGDSHSYKFSIEIENLWQWQGSPIKIIKDVDVKEGIRGNNIYVKIKPPIMIKANNAMSINFSITGGATYASQEVFRESKHEEVTYWKNEIIKIEFKSSHTVPSGLQQIPILQFSESIPRYPPPEFNTEKSLSVNRSILNVNGFYDASYNGFSFGSGSGFWH